MPSLLVLVRHGQSVGNLTGDYSHRRHDNLTDLGWAQARAAAAGWAGPFDRFVVSSLGRARQTILPTLKRFGVRAEVWPDLAECCWQEPRSLPPSDPELPGVPLTWDEGEREWFDLDGPLVTPPDDERWQDGLRRMRRAAARLDGLARASGGQSILAVSHGYAISKLVILLTGKGDVNDVYDLANTQTLRLEPEGDRWRLLA